MLVTAVLLTFNRASNLYLSGSGSVVGIENGYGLDGPGVESQWGRDFMHPSRSALPDSYSMGSGVFAGLKRLVSSFTHPIPC